MADTTGSAPDDGSDVELEDEDEKVRVPLDTYAAIPASPLPPMAPDGGILPGSIGTPPPVPAADPAIFVCLRGPCRHYWEMVTHLVAGNPGETWGEDGLKDPDGKPLVAPRQVSRVCQANPGTETEITDDVVYACNRWDPLLPSDQKALEKRRRVYLKQFPQYRSNR